MNIIQVDPEINIVIEGKTYPTDAILGRLKNHNGNYLQDSESIPKQGLKFESLVLICKDFNLYVIEEFDIMCRSNSTEFDQAIKFILKFKCILYPIMLSLVYIESFLKIFTKKNHKILKIIQDHNSELETMINDIIGAKMKMNWIDYINSRGKAYMNNCNYRIISSPSSNQEMLVYLIKDNNTY
ncbi:MAG: hypothetical protein ACRCXZ_06625 [Patescibacteria group bacterium]